MRQLLLSCTAVARRMYVSRTFVAVQPLRLEEILRGRRGRVRYHSKYQLHKGKRAVRSGLLLDNLWCVGSHDVLLKFRRQVRRQRRVRQQGSTIVEQGIAASPACTGSQRDAADDDRLQARTA